MAKLLLLASLLAIGIALSACSDSKDETPEEQLPSAADLAAVHPCLEGIEVRDGEPTQTEATPTSPSEAADAAGPTPAGDPACEGPDFSQRCALWAGSEYDHGGGQAVDCGTTIAQCGCALTSAASVLVHYGVARGPDGQATTPATLNDWLRQDPRETDAGVVSRGYVYGGVNWLAVAAYSAEASASAGGPEIVWGGWLQSDLAALSRELAAGTEVILEQPGHFIVATDIADGEVLIHDPYYAERARLDGPAYRNSFISGRLFRPGTDASAILVAAPRGPSFSVRDGEGRRTGVDAGSGRVMSQIEKSSFGRETAWSDPTCTTTASGEPRGVQMAVLSQPEKGRYEVEVTGDAEGRFSVAVYAYDEDGGTTIETFDGALATGESARVVIEYDPAAGAEQEIYLEELTPTPTPSPATATTPEPLTATPSSEPTATSTATPTFTATPSPTATPGPAATLTLEFSPAAFICNGKRESTITVTARDAGGGPAAPTQVLLKQSAGTLTPGAVTTQGGTATAILTPPVMNGQITVNVNVLGSPVSTSAVFNCVSILPLPTFGGGEILPPPAPTTAPIP